MEKKQQQQQPNNTISGMMEFSTSNVDKIKFHMFTYPIVTM